MARVHLLDTSQFGVEQAPVVVVDCSTGRDEGVFDAKHARAQARKLKKQAAAGAVVVQFGAKFWVV